MSEERPELLTVDQVAVILGVSRRTVYRLSSGSDPDLYWVRLTPNSDRRWPRSCVNAYLELVLKRQVPSYILKLAA